MELEFKFKIWDFKFIVILGYCWNILWEWFIVLILVGSFFFGIYDIYFIYNISNIVILFEVWFVFMLMKYIWG